jgi:DNA polymerase I-like protein with 3'-5' exonuclease and polymerase domains
MSNPAMKLFGKHVKELGFSSEDFTFVTPCPPIPEEIQKSEAKIGIFLEEHRKDFLTAIEREAKNARMVVCMGKSGNRQHAGKPTAITKVRGTLTERPATGLLPVLPTLGAAHVMTRPENEDIFCSDLRLLAALRDCSWDLDAYRSSGSTSGYKWCLDLQFLVDKPPAGMAIDCETVGLDWHRPGFRVLNVSITTAEGNAYVVPLDAEYFNNPELRRPCSGNKLLTVGQIAKLKEQLQALFSNPEISTVGHNLKFDIHSLRAVGLRVENWWADTMQLAFAVDDNMMLKSLSECTRRWVPALAGYSDVFDANTDKARMDAVPHDEMLDYAGGDTDSTFRLAKTLAKLCRQDTANWNTFLKVQMPTLRAFVELEETGLMVDKDKLRELEISLDQMEKDLYKELMEDVPVPVLKKHEGNWSFSSTAFTVDVLFGPNGIKDDHGRRLKPLVFTESTKKLPPDQRVPSISAKAHLPFFDHIPFVQKLQRYSKLQKMRSTYVGSEGKKHRTKVHRTTGGLVPARIAKHIEGFEFPRSTAVRRRRRIIELSDTPMFAGMSPEDLGFVDIPISDKHILHIDQYGNIEETKVDPPSGFYRYIEDDPVIHAQFYLHRTVTGRAASADPNLQNIPKRGELAKLFRKVFVAPPGYVLLEADLSQAEVRVAGWMANDKTLIRIYKEGGDVHSATAASLINKSYDAFVKGRSDQTLLMSVANDWLGAGSYLKTFGSNARAKLTVADFCDFKRYQAKAVNFGLLYSMGAAGLRRYAKVEYGIDMEMDEAEAIRVKFFKTYSGLAAWHKGMETFVRSKGYVRALHGALRRLPSINSDDDGVQAGAVRQAINSPVQRFASDLGLIALHRLIRDAPKDKIKPMMFIHDAIVVAVREDCVDEMAAALKFYMESPPLEEWFGLKAPFPIVSDVSKGVNLGEMEEMKGLQAKAPSWYRSGEEAPNPKLAAAWQKKRKRSIVLADA